SGDADALLPLAPVELGALAGVIAQRHEDGCCRCEQSVFTRGRGKLRQPRAEDEPALHVPRDEPVVLERHGEAMRRRAGEMSARDELREGHGSRLESAENERGFVKYADSARVVHKAILPSQFMRRKLE